MTRSITCSTKNWPKGSGELAAVATGRARLGRLGRSPSPVRYVAAMLIRSLVALSLTSVALLAGCGDDEPKAGAGTTPSAAQSATSPAAASVATTPADQEALAKAEAESKPKKRDKSKDPSWVVAVNERCQAYRKQSTEVLEKFSKSGVTTPAAAADAMKQVAPLGQQLIKDLRPTDVPADVQEDWTAFLDTLDGAFDLMPEIIKSVAASQPDPELMKKFAEVEKKTRPFADKYGLDECLAS